MYMRLRNLAQATSERWRRAWGASRLRARSARYFSVFTDPGAGWGRRLGYAVGGLASVALLGLLLLLAFALALIPFTPGIESLKKAKSERPAVVQSADGKELASFRRLNRDWVKLDAISPAVIDALIATEDHRFFEHRGIDLRRTVASAVYTLGGDRQGGSTITQQLARNLYPEQIGRAASLTRKLKEIITALKIESVYSKQEILETYLNTVPFLYNAYGIEMAARTYFSKSARELDVLQGATLIAMLKGTSYYNPILNPQRAKERRNVVLSQMARNGKLKPDRLAVLQKRPLRTDFERQREPIGAAPHFAEHLRKWLIEWADRNGYDINGDGLKVFTTIDSRLQAVANRAVTKQLDALQAVADVEWAASSEQLMSTDLAAYAGRRQRVEPFAHFWKSKGALVETFMRESPAYRALGDEVLDDAQRLARLRGDAKFMAALRAEKTRLQAGFMALDPRNGHVKAWVGSRDFAQDQFDHVIQARRQPGSTFKPFVYGAALQQGMTPATWFYDKAVEIKSGGTVWRPTDAGEPTGERMTLRDGLAQSKNTITAQVMQKTGPAKVAKVAHDLGVRQSKLDPVPSLALGTSPVTLSEMVSGYASIANGGNYIEPILVTRIEDSNGVVLETFASTPEPALAPAAANVLLDMMRGVINEGTGTGIRRIFGIQADVSGKTGTTQDNTDGWFILMHGQLVGGAWVGFNDNRVTMRSAHWGQGAHNALYVVGDFFKQAFEARIIEAGPRVVVERERRAEAPLDRFGSWLGNVFDRGSRAERGSQRLPQLQLGEEIDTRPYPGPWERREEYRGPRGGRPDDYREYREPLRSRPDDYREYREPRRGRPEEYREYRDDRGPRRRRGNNNDDD